IFGLVAIEVYQSLLSAFLGSFFPLGPTFFSASTSMILPPAASIAARAPAVTRRPFSVNGLVTSPDSLTFTRRITLVIRFASQRGYRSITSELRSASSLVLTYAVIRPILEVKPYLGRRHCKGI